MGTMSAELAFLEHKGSSLHACSALKMDDWIQFLMELDLETGTCSLVDTVESTDCEAEKPCATASVAVTAANMRFVRAMTLVLGRCES